MPSVPKHPCSKNGCPEVVPRGERFCQKHKSLEMHRYNKERGSSTKQGYGVAWKKLRRMVLRRQPVCTHCNEQPSVLVHHIKSIKEYPELRLTASNLTGLCFNCHESIERDRGLRWGQGSSRKGGKFHRLSPIKLKECSEGWL